MNVSTLTTDGYVTVEYPSQLRKKVLDAMQSWQDFCGLSKEEKLKLSKGDRKKDFGYMLRQDEGSLADSKELFQVARRDFAELKERADFIEDSKAKAFIDAIDVLITETSPVVQEFAQDVEREYALTGFEDEVMEFRHNWTFRYLHYFGGDMLAHEHVDRGGFTFHLHESHPGGEYLTLDKEWKPWPVSDKQTIIFPSMNLQYRSAGELKALWHKVGSTEETSQEGRYSMVLFVDFKEEVKYNQEKRTQELEPGFNYTMPFDEYKQMFIPR